MAMVDSVVLGRCHALIISLCRNARLMKHNPRDKTAYLTTVPNEIIDRVSCFLDGPDKAALAVTCSKLYLSLQCDLAKMPAWETAECSRRLKRGGYFKRQQLPCFSCAEMHPMSNFYSPELNQPLPQCIAKCRMWCCACKSVTAQEIQAAAQLDPARTSPRANDMRDLFDPCQSCHDDEGLCCIGTVVGGAPITLSIVHKIKFQVPHIGLNIAVLLKAVAARCRTFALPLCRHTTLADSRVLEAFDSTCHGSGVACPTTCQTRQHQHHIKPLAACPMKGCGLKFGISQEYLGHMDESWNVTITISRRLPSFNEHLKRDRAWSSLAFTNAELSKLLPGVFSTPRSGSDDVLALVRSHLFRNTGWEYDRKMLRQFMKGKGWIGEIGARRGEQSNSAAHSA